MFDTQSGEALFASLPEELKTYLQPYLLTLFFFQSSSVSYSIPVFCLMLTTCRASSSRRASKKREADDHLPLDSAALWSLTAKSHIEWLCELCYSLCA